MGVIVNQEPSYYAIIPATVRYDKDLKANEKLMYGEITAMSNKKGYCWATNSYFAELYGVHKNTVSNWVSSLSEKGYIKIVLIYKKDSKEVKERKIYINDVPVKNNVDEVKEKESESEKEKNDVKYNKIHSELAKILWGYVIQNFPKTKKPNVDVWSDNIRLMMEQDGLSEIEIKNAIHWSQNNKFWKTNIRSTSKLRKQYEELYAQATLENVYFDKDQDEEKQSERKELREKAKSDFGELQDLLTGKK